MTKVFNTQEVDWTKQPMFFGAEPNTQRFDQQKYPIFEKLNQQQLGFFWRPEEVDVSKDRVDFQKLSEAEQHIFISNLKYQTLLDSVQGRSPNIALLPIVSIPELETWIETWAFSETIHSRSYTHIIRNVYADPSKVFDELMDIQEKTGTTFVIVTHDQEEAMTVASRVAVMDEGRIVEEGSHADLLAQVIFFSALWFLAIGPILASGWWWAGWLIDRRRHNLAIASGLLGFGLLTGWLNLGLVMSLPP